MRSSATLMFFLFLLISLPAYAKGVCDTRGVWLQVLGSGGPELGDDRASTGYLIWRDGKARVLVDMGGGSMLRFEQSGASLNDLDVILLSHLHVDHSSDLPILIKASYFSGRQRDLPVYGPGGNALMPSMDEFVKNLFGPDGAFRYLNDYLTGAESYRLLPQTVDASGKTQQVVISDKDYRILAVPVHHGPIPALAWRVETGGHSLVFSGDMNNDNKTLATLAKHADLLVAHLAIPEQANKVARELHMPPSVIGKIAGRASVGKLVLSHRMKRTLGREKEMTALIRHNYHGPMQFANDLDCFKP